jgi:hypothetical protein
MTKKQTATLCKIAIEATLQIALNGHDNTRLLNACNHAIGILQQSFPFLASHWMRDMATKMIRSHAGARGP